MDKKKHYLNLRIEEDLLNRLREYDNYSDFTRNALEKQIEYIEALDSMSDQEIGESFRAIIKILENTEENTNKYRFFNLIISDFFRVIGNRSGMRKELL